MTGAALKPHAPRFVRRRRIAAAFADLALGLAILTLLALAFWRAS